MVRWLGQPPGRQGSGARFNVRCRQVTDLHNPRAGSSCATDLAWQGVQSSERKWLPHGGGPHGKLELEIGTRNCRLPIVRQRTTAHGSTFEELLPSISLHSILLEQTPWRIMHCVSLLGQGWGQHDSLSPESPTGLWVIHRQS